MAKKVLSAIGSVGCLVLGVTALVIGLLSMYPVLALALRLPSTETSLDWAMTVEGIIFYGLIALAGMTLGGFAIAKFGIPLLRKLRR